MKSTIPRVGEAHLVSHQELVEGCRSGRLRLRVEDDFMARQVIETGFLSRAAAFPHFLVLWTGLARIPAAACLAVFWNVWGGVLAGLALLLVPFRKLIKKVDRRIVLARVLADRAFYEAIDNRGVIRIEPVANVSGRGSHPEGAPGERDQRDA